MKCVAWRRMGRRIEAHDAKQREAEEGAAAGARGHEGGKTIVETRGRQPSHLLQIRNMRSHCAQTAKANRIVFKCSLHV
jgi:hypothetical protein